MTREEAPDRILLMQVPVGVGLRGILFMHVPVGVGLRVLQWRENPTPGGKLGIEYVRADWESASDEWSEDIHAAYPTRSDSHEEYAIAMQMVGHRHSKGALVALVNWLLVRARKSESEANVMAETLRIAQGRCTELLEEVRRLKPQPPVCLCTVLGGKRYAHGACMAFHDVKASGFVNAQGAPVLGSFTGEGR